MRSNDSGVAGFFEDLPVLAFVLCGVMLLVSSGLWTTSRLASEREDERLQELAERAVERIVQKIESLAPGYETPMLESIDQSDLSHFVRDLLDSTHFSVNISSPGRTDGWCVGFNDNHSGEVSNTAFASSLLNAQDFTGLVVVLEVRLIVWKD